jgi:hypothetical protein
MADLRLSSLPRGVEEMYVVFPLNLSYAAAVSVASKKIYRYIDRQTDIWIDR